MLLNRLSLALPCNGGTTFPCLGHGWVPCLVPLLAHSASRYGGHYASCTACLAIWRPLQCAHCSDTRLAVMDGRQHIYGRRAVQFTNGQPVGTCSHTTSCLGRSPLTRLSIRFAFSSYSKKSNVTCHMQRDRQRKRCTLQPLGCLVSSVCKLQQLTGPGVPLQVRRSRGQSVPPATICMCTHWPKTALEFPGF